MSVGSRHGSDHIIIARPRKRGGPPLLLLRRELRTQLLFLLPSSGVNTSPKSSPRTLSDFDLDSPGIGLGSA